MGFNNFPVIKVKELCCNFGEKEILHNIDIEFVKGGFYSIIGANGSGKTTLLKNIASLIPPNRHKVFVENVDVLNFKNRDLAKKLSIVPQNTNLDFEFSVLDIVLMGRNPYLSRFQDESKEDYNVVKESMKMTNTWELKDKRINQLSGGEQQRVVIARALAQSTDIILMDEPISHLDIHHQVEILDTIKSINRKVTVIAVLHDLNLAAQYSDYLILIDKGSIVAMGAPEKVLTEENIKKVYNINICIINNPITGKPHIIPISKTINKVSL